jgi:peptide/nickel transport system substrate-binding protein
MLKKSQFKTAVLFLFLLVLSACNLPGSSAATVAPTEAAAATETAVPTETPVPQRVLSVCLGQEPRSLFLYNTASSRAAWAVLEGVYDGPIDTLTNGSQPVILESLPTLENGGVTVQAVTVAAGQEVINAEGEVVILASGARVFPAGCTSPDCALLWDGSTPLQLDQVSVQYRLKPALTWSDGTPLRADDSVYSFELAADPDLPVSRFQTSRTLSYQAVDDQTVTWTGKPGYFPARFDGLFFTPLPRHAWGNLKAVDLLADETVNRSPLGWGPYQVQEWVAGDHITLVKNPAYFRASEGLPKFDQLVFRFLGEPADNNLSALLAGECDVVDQTSLLEEQLEPILEMQRDGKLTAVISPLTEWEQINFGIKPASYDDGYNAFTGDRPDFFNDLRMRQAFAYCLDRQGFVNKPLENQTQVPVGFYPPEHPLGLKDVQPLAYDPAAGTALLDAAGWKDFDNDPATPRVAAGVPGVADGTPLAVKYVTTQAPLRVQLAGRLKESAAACGIQLDVQTLAPGELFAQGPAGPVFGRQFDLAEFGWEAGMQSPCRLYQSDQMPSSANNWLGTNIAGYGDPTYDRLCQAARQSRSGESDYLEKQLAVQKYYAEQLPSIPLYFRFRMAVARPDFCGLQLDPAARSLLWNLETVDYGDGCKNP